MVGPYFFIDRIREILGLAERKWLEINNLNEESENGL